MCQEQQGSQHRALRYARINLGPGRMLTTDDDSLDTVLEKTADPGTSSILDTIAIEFLKKPIMRDNIERFAKIHDDHVNLFFVIKGMS